MRTSQKKELGYLKAMQSGDQSAFRWVYNQYHPVIFLFCRRLLLQDTLAEEATADVFVLLWKKRGIIDVKRSVSPLLYKMAKDTAFNYLKRISSNEQLKNNYINSYPLVEVENGESILLSKEHQLSVNKLIDCLPPKCREVCRLYYFEGLDNQSIANHLAISKNTVKAHLAKARHYLREHLQEEGLALLLIVLGKF